MQNEYINRDKLLNHMFSKAAEEVDVMLEIANFPAADVVEVVHAKAVLDDEGIFLVCSNCGCQEPLNYCKWCGAKMDGERE